MSWQILNGDCREVLAALPAASVHTCVTSPPYFGLRDYGHDGQIGLEPTPDEFVEALVGVFREVWRVLRDDGTVWLNLGDSYVSHKPGKDAVLSQSEGFGSHKAGFDGASVAVDLRSRGWKSKDLIGIPWLVAFALRADGWYLRSEIIWHKPNPMPESVTDRPTKAHEQVFLLSKSPRYFYDADAIREDAKDWTTGGPGTGIENTAERYGAGNGGNDGLAKLAASYRTRGTQGASAARAGADGSPDRDNPGGGVGQANGGRNKRSVWTVSTMPYAGAHFATFPPKLIEPCILAGCPERCCSECGAPWERVVESDAPGHKIATTQPKRLQNMPDQPPQSEIVHGRQRWTLGFEASCTHNADTTPGTVLDPFAGAGTTGMVALRHGRSFVGVELNAEYAALARARIVDDCPLHNHGLEVAA